MSTPDFTGKLTELERRFSIKVEYWAEISSTNDRATAVHYAHGDVIWAERQTKGRGQRGNSWNSDAGKNLTFSLVLKPDGFPVELQFYLSKIISIGLVEALQKFNVSATIKWPNDIYVGDKKIIGILIENDLSGNGIVRSIAGIGLNVNQQTFDPSLPNPTSMCQVSENGYDRVEVLQIILEKIFFWYNLLLREEYEIIDRAYMRYLYRKEGKYLFKEPEHAPFEASIYTVEPSGELILEQNTGDRKGYFFKEIEFII